MNNLNILALVEALRVAGQAEIGAPRYLDQHNAQVDAAAKALVAEIEGGRDLLGVAHEIWATAQLLPGEGIEDSIRRLVALLEDKT